MEGKKADIDPSISEPTWTEIECDSSGAREEHTCTLFQDYIIAIGGTEQRNRLSDVIVFDIRKSTWQRIKPSGDVFLPRGGHTACLFGENQIIIYGGHSTEYAEYQYKTMRETGILTITSIEPFELEWKVKITRGEVDRIYHTAHVYKDSMYVFGGGDENYQSTNDIYHLNLESFVWTQCHISGDPLIECRSHWSTMYKGKVYLFGGFKTKTRSLINDIHVFELSTLKMTRIRKTHLWPGVVSGCSVSEHEGELYVFGGKVYDNTFTNDLVVFNIENETWRHIRPKGYAPTPRGYHRCVCYQNSIFFWGGSVDTIAYSNIYRLFLGPEPEEEETIKDGKIVMRPKERKYTVHMKALLLNENHSDICFKVQDQKFHAHKNILSARCKYFENMFSSQMIEAQTTEISIPNVKPEIFKGLIEFIYCDELELSESLAFDLLELTNKYAYSDLRDLCVEFLSKYLTLDNLIAIANLSETLELPTLQKATSNFAMLNYDYLEKEQLLYDLPKPILVELLQKMKRR